MQSKSFLYRLRRSWLNRHASACTIRRCKYTEGCFVIFRRSFWGLYRWCGSECTLWIQGRASWEASGLGCIDGRRSALFPLENTSERERVGTRRVMFWRAGCCRWWWRCCCWRRGSSTRLGFLGWRKPQSIYIIHVCDRSGEGSVREWHCFNASAVNWILCEGGNG